MLGIVVWKDDLPTVMQSSSGDAWMSNRVLWQILCVFHYAIVDLGFILFIFDSLLDLFIQVQSGSYFSAIRVFFFWNPIGEVIVIFVRLVKSVRRELEKLTSDSKCIVGRKLLPFLGLFRLWEYGIPDSGFKTHHSYFLCYFFLIRGNKW